MIKRLLALLLVWWRDEAVWIVDTGRRQAILDAGGPAIDILHDGTEECTECHATALPCSPSMLEHHEDCPGEHRFEQLRKLLYWGDQI